VVGVSGDGYGQGPCETAMDTRGEVLGGTGGSPAGGQSRWGITVRADRQSWPAGTTAHGIPGSRGPAAVSTASTDWVSAGTCRGASGGPRTCDRSPRGAGVALGHRRAECFAGICGRRVTAGERGRRGGAWSGSRLPRGSQGRTIGHRPAVAPSCVAEKLVRRAVGVQQGRNAPPLSPPPAPARPGSAADPHSPSSTQNALARDLSRVARDRFAGAPGLTRGRTPGRAFFVPRSGLVGEKGSRGENPAGFEKRRAP